MPYKKSRARLDFDTARTEICANLKLVDKAAPPISDYVKAAAIFLSHAELENYIDDIFSNYAAAIQVNILKGSQLPSELRSFLFLSKSNAASIYGKFLSDRSEKKLIKNFGVALSGHAGAIVNDNALVPKFTGQDIYSNHKYPSKDNLLKLFYRIGVDNLFHELNSHLRQDSESLLDSLSSLRTQLAHTAALPGISTKDIADRIKDAARFVGAIDRVMYKNLSSHFSSSLWALHMC